MDLVRGKGTVMPPCTHHPTGRYEWRCRACRLLLGVASQGVLQVKYKDVEHRIRGACEHACRRCGATNAIVVDRDVCRTETTEAHSTPSSMELGPCTR
jgi:hypothetical protein